MDKTYRVVLFGHRDFDGHKILEEYLYPFLSDLIRTKPFVEIYIGRNGEFDLYAAAIMKRVQKSMGKDNNELICVLPYPEKNVSYYEKYYDDVIIPECVEKTHPKGAITKRNRWMIEQADIFVCYVERETGGAYDALKYAKKLKKQIINIAKAVTDKN
ncbi:MAG: hypothetical protein E7673_03405 [Ruminococcaceae bacterium]|nr:hypothetical protein [Oscillospiraceae bacterium]